MAAQKVFVRHHEYNSFSPATTSVHLNWHISSKEIKHSGGSENYSYTCHMLSIWQKKKSELFNASKQDDVLNQWHYNQKNIYSQQVLHANSKNL